MVEVEGSSNDRNPIGLFANVDIDREPGSPLPAPCLADAGLQPDEPAATSLPKYGYRRFGPPDQPREIGNRSRFFFSITASN